VTCFINFCSLSKVIAEIMMTVGEGLRPSRTKTYEILHVKARTTCPLILWELLRPIPQEPALQELSPE
jgi:hypothetical protein